MVLRIDLRGRVLTGGRCVGARGIGACRIGTRRIRGRGVGLRSLPGLRHLLRGDRAKAVAQTITDVSRDGRNLGLR
jgi:hypothetical protein